MKNCNLCKIDKPITDFYERKDTKTKLNARCKVCVLVRQKKHKQDIKANPNFKRDAAREWNAKNRHKHKIYNDNWIKKFPEKNKAIQSNQRLKRTVVGSQFHHWSYNLEHHKDVIELMTEDHTEIHTLTVYDQSFMMYRIKSTGELLDTKLKTLNFIKSLNMEIYG